MLHIHYELCPFLATWPTVGCLQQYPWVGWWVRRVGRSGGIDNEYLSLDWLTPLDSIIWHAPVELPMAIFWIDLKLQLHELFWPVWVNFNTIWAYYSLIFKRMFLSIPITDLLADFLLFSLVIVSQQEPYWRKSADQQNAAGVLELLFVPVRQCKHEQHFTHPPSAHYLKPFPQHGIPQY